jgi:hypothetical protein
MRSDNATLLEQWNRGLADGAAVAPHIRSLNQPESRSRFEMEFDWRTIHDSIASLGQRADEYPPRHCADTQFLVKQVTGKHTSHKSNAVAVVPDLILFVVASVIVCTQR